MKIPKHHQSVLECEDFKRGIHHVSGSFPFTVCCTKVAGKPEGGPSLNFPEKLPRSIILINGLAEWY